jgi:uncharacterized protein YndB with AHSA1/START domain/DNA-binding transcriptional ArsR family regulator
MRGHADDEVFRALADPTRRRLLDRLHERNGQTLNELCAGLDMRRQSVTQHLQVLEGANLVSLVRRGRERLHYLNPVPLHEMQERWIDKFERSPLRALSAVKRQAEGDPVTADPSHVYVTYIASSADRVWEALLDADLTARYWGHSNVSSWEPGARWEHRRTDGSGIADVVGTVLETDPPRRLVLTFEAPDGSTAPTQLTFEIEEHADIVRLTVTHDGLVDRAAREAAMAGWASVLANLKTLLETGDVMPQPPWEMHAALREELMARNDAR